MPVETYLGSMQYLDFLWLNLHLYLDLTFVWLLPDLAFA